MRSTTELPRKKALLLEWALWAIPAYLALGVWMNLHYLLSVDNDKQYALHNERVIVDLIEEVLGETLVRMSADAKNLAYVTSNIVSQPQNPYHNLKAYFVQLSTNNHSYDQIRFIDTQGAERLRVNNRNGVVSVVPQDKLQNKAHRYYWQHSNRLTEGHVYISPLDLNVEGGEIQQPINPTIRVGTPVFDAIGNRVGVILLNYKGNQLINKLLTVAPSFTNHIYLYNPQGIAVIHPSDAGGSNFAISPDRGIPNNVLNDIKTSDEGQHLIGQSYYTFAKIKAPNNGNWTIVSAFPLERFNLSRQAFHHEYTLLYGLLFAMLTFASVVFARYRVQTRELRHQQRYEQQFRHTLENIQLAAVSINQQGNITFCNDFFLNMVGYQAEEVIGQAWVECFIPKELHQQAQEALHEAIRQQTHQPHSESVVMSKTGEIHLVSWTSTFTQSNDQAVALTLIGEDITEQKMAQDQLQRLSHAVESSQNSVMITDLDGQIVYVNPVFCELTGYNREDVLGKTPRFLQSGETKQQDYDQLWQTIQKGEEWRGEFHNRKKSGELFWERARISPVKDIEGRSLYYVAVKQDISEEKRLAQEVDKQTRERIHHEKLAAVGKVVNMIAHDLRNPLSSIKMVLQLQSRSNPSEMFDISLEQVRYMEAILEELLAYSRPDQLSPEWIDLNKLLETLIAGQQKLAKQSEVRMELHLQPHLPTVYADATKLRQALQNILLNAMQAAKSSSQPVVKISSNIMITESETQLLINIENNGQSIDPCMAEKVFEPFFTTKAKGTGLGLAIAKRNIDAHQGYIKLIPQVEGTLATIRIPTSSVGLTISPDKTMTETGSLSL
ncbi:PAS domain S-box protein [Vibrio sp. 404]|uniref:histidine kinase n=1 Tax=Vibrio marinisediminis TaxID=2758441 RepID=A0A7W2FNH5_9VIBR|nr:PAS domain S-box protein [Vibrio marinisediminis]MBA5761370.1 PAS domain S-box protein [Vibrio marinisediminis]